MNEAVCLSDELVFAEFAATRIDQQEMPILSSRIKQSVVAVLMTMTPPAMAQTPPVDPLPNPRLPAPDKTIPEQLYPCNPGDYKPPEFAELPNAPIDCGEIIVPPPGIDPEIKAPAPKPYPGTTPVIPPAAIDQQ